MQSGRRIDRRLVTALAGLATLSVATFVVSIGAAFLVGRPANSPIEPGSLPFSWRTDSVQIGAHMLRVEANGLTFSGDQTGTVVKSEPASVVLSWHEHDLDLRIYFGFMADARSWWVNDIRVSDGVEVPSGKWAMFPPGPYFTTPLGQTWGGDIDLTGSGRTGPVTLHMEGAAIRANPPRSFAAPPDGGIPLPAGSLPFAGGGKLHCSGILQMTPRNAHAALLSMGYRVSWRLLSMTASGSNANQPPGLGIAVDEWEFRLEPPDGTITDPGIPVSDDGAVVMSVVPFGHADAGPPPVPADCPGGSSPSTRP